MRDSIKESGFRVILNRQRDALFGSKMFPFLDIWDVRILHWVGFQLFTLHWAHWARFIGEVNRFYTTIVALSVVLIVERKLKGFLIVLHVLLSVATTNFVSSELIKHSVKRPRPCVTEPVTGFATSCNDQSPSFPSSHAANSMAIAVVGFHYHPIYGSLLLVFSLVTGMARVYIGVHYPSDVVFGWFVGLVITLALSRGVVWSASKLGFRRRGS